MRFADYQGAKTKMSFFPLLDTRSLSDLIALFMSDPSAHGVEANEAEVFFQEAAVAIAKCGNDGLAFLLDSLAKVDAPRRQAILVGLSFADKDSVSPFLGRIKAALSSFLSSADADLVAKAVESINYLGLVEMADSVVTLLHHESAFVIGSVLRFFSRHFPSQARPMLLEALNSPEPIVRQNAIDELDELECKDALPSILRLFEDPDKDVREAAHWAADHLGSLPGGLDVSRVDGPISSAPRTASSQDAGSNKNP